MADKPLFYGSALDYGNDAPAAVDPNSDAYKQAAALPASPLPAQPRAGTVAVQTAPTPGISSAPVAAKPVAGPANPFGTSFDVGGLAKYLHDARMNDVGEGMAFGNQYFGQGNGQIAEIENAQRQRALNGFSPQERQLYEQKSTGAINNQIGTGLRAVRSGLSTNGVRGGAAAGFALPVIQQANTARANASTDLNIADMQARRQAMNDYQGTVTGERAGQLGTAFGFGSLGAGDRSNALTYGLGSDYLKQANDDVKKIGEPDLSNKGWNAKDSYGNWKDHNFDPNYMPVFDYLHKNVWDKKDIGLPEQLPNGFFPHSWANN